MWNPFKRLTPEESFWRWFQSNDSRLFRFERDQERVFDELSAELKKVDSSLCFEFGPEVDGRREFIISADGDKKAFGAVQALAGAAPRLKKWEVIPFRPPKDLKKYPKVAYSNVELSSDDVWFSFQTEGSTIHLDLYIRGLSEENETDMGGLSFLLLDSALGEYVVETRIGGISRQSLPDNADGLNLLPFRVITEIVKADVH